MCWFASRVSTWTITRLARVREQIMHGLENFSGLGKTEVFYNGTLIPENAPSGFSVVKLNPGVPARTVAINSNGQMVARDDYMSNAGEQLLLRGVTQLSSPGDGLFGGCLRLLGE